MRTLAEITHIQDRLFLLEWWENWPVEIQGEIIYPNTALLNDRIVCSTDDESWELQRTLEEREILDSDKELLNRNNWKHIKNNYGQEFIFPPQLNLQG